MTEGAIDMIETMAIITEMNAIGMNRDITKEDITRDLGLVFQI